MNPTYSRLVLPILSTILLVLTACTPWQDPTVDIPERDKAALEDLKQVDQKLTSIAELNTRQQLDSLLTWTVLLKNSAEDAALAYAREATRMATETNQREDQAMGRYYMALLEGRQQVFREGLADPLVNARISKELWDQTSDDFWIASANHLIGDLYYRQDQLDSAEQYFNEALKIENSAENPAVQGLVGNIFQGLGLLKADEEDYNAAENYFDKASEQYTFAKDQRSAAILLQEYAYLAYYRDDIDTAIRLADSAVVLAEALEDNYNLDYSLQLSGEMLVKKYRVTSDSMIFNMAKDRFNSSLAIQEGNYFYTYRKLGVLMQSRANRDLNGGRYVDSALVYYKLALENAREEGALKVFRSVSKDISKLCEWLSTWREQDCAAILGATSASYLYNNYFGVVDTITNDLAQANANFLSFQRQQQEISSRQRVQRTWTIALGGLLFALFVFLFLFQQQKQKRLQARMEALRAQINPHFFSNSLNAIESLVNLDQRKAASKYLIHFSRLTRRVLNSSMETSTTLAGELETTKHFLALEQLRFKDKLHYEIEVAENIDPHFVKIPSLIFQPYLENAIWHGIKPKEEPSILQIKIYREDKHLLCIIEDDGIGREAARAQQEKTLLQKKSVGMKITKERLQSFGGGTVAVTDLHHEDGSARGTQVLLRLPYKTYEA